jgi:hypothetical protein
MKELVENNLVQEPTNTSEHLPPATCHSPLRKLFREPLVHFLLIGAGLFLLFGWKGNPASMQGGQQPKKIMVAQDTVDQLVAAFTRTWMRPPTKGEVKGLIDNHIRDEIYYREAVAIGLDQGDALIRRKLRQKMEFILEDIAAQTEPTDEDLERFMTEHREKYLIDPQIAFRQVFVSVDLRGDSAEEHALQLLEQLGAGADPDALGDRSLIDHKAELYSLWEIRRQYGDAFGKQILELEPGRWTGPLRSGFGLHLVFVDERVVQPLPELKVIRDTVDRDWAVALQQKLKDDAYAKLRERYTVQIENPTNGIASAQAGEMENRL